MAEQGFIAIARTDENRYASCEDFLRIFDQDMRSFYQLSHVLTGDRQKAERCFVASVEDCAKENRVFREWARPWAKRVIVQNAIRELQPRPSHPDWCSVLPTSFSQKTGPIERLDVETVLGLGDFERFVFVLCVLERYREHDCALLLSCSASEVREARTQAIHKLAKLWPSVLDVNRNRERGRRAAALKA